MYQIRMIIINFVIHVKELIRDVKQMFGSDDDDDHWNGGFKVAVQ